jgi:hypothetical protein
VRLTPCSIFLVLEKDQKEDIFMAKKKNTELKLSEIKKQAKTSHQKEVFERKDGSTITFYPVFPDLLIEEMLEEMQNHYKIMQEKKIKLNEKMNLYFIYLMMIKHFTHFKKSMTNNLISSGKSASLLDYLDHFADTGLLKEIIEDVFMKDQVMKVFDKVTDLTANSLFISQLENETIEKLQKVTYENKDIYKKLKNKVEEQQGQ